MHGIQVYPRKHTDGVCGYSDVSVWFQVAQYPSMPVGFITKHGKRYWEYKKY